MSIPVLIENDTVGKLKACWECVFEKEEKNLFSRSLMGATIQDGGTREKRVFGVRYTVIDIRKKC